MPKVKNITFMYNISNTFNIKHILYNSRSGIQTWQLLLKKKPSGQRSNKFCTMYKQEEEYMYN